MILALAYLAAIASPSAEAKRLGLRLARTSGIVTIAPLLIEKDLAELAKEDSTITADERQRVLTLGREEGKRGLDRVSAALGDAYAQRLSLSDLKVLVRQNESAEAVRRRAAEPEVLMSAMAALGSLDLKKNTAVLMCKEAKKLCNRD